MEISANVLAAKMRALALNMVHKAKASHIGSILSIIDIVAVLYSDIMVFDPRDPQNRNRDRLILSKGHAGVAVYAALAESGFFSPELLATYGEDFSPFMNHISHKVPGVEFSTGALGHGFPFAVGKALSAKVSGNDWRSFVILSDGEMDEGSNWEALLFAAHHRLDGVIAIIDYNKLQSLNSVANTLALEPLEGKLKMFGAEVIRVDGHSYSQLSEALSMPSADRPRVIIADTVKGKGVDFMENKVEWHYRSPNADQLAAALAQIEASLA